MKKTKLLSLLLAIAMVISLLPASVFAATFTDKETITIELFDDWGDGWTGSKIIAYLWDGETKTLLNDEITIEEGVTATFEFEVNVGSEVCFYWQKGEYDSECSFEITRGDYVFSATQADCDKLVDGSIFYLSTPEGEGDLNEFYDIWEIVGLEGANDEGILLNRRANGNYVLTKDLEAGDYEFKLVLNNAMDEKYGSKSGALIEKGLQNEVSADSEESFKFTLADKACVTFVFNPIDLVLLVTWTDNSEEGSSTIAIGEDIIEEGPFNTYYYYSACQYVIPSEMISSLSGKILTDISYYYNVSSGVTHPQSLEIYLQEVEKDTLETFVDISDATKVFDGSVELSKNSGMQELTLDFDTDFAYGGGDLLVTVEKDSNGCFGGTMFYGINGCGLGVYAVNDTYNFDISELVGEVENIETTGFMPMMSFGYEKPVYEIINYIDGEVILDIPVPGNYTVVFAHYEGERLDNVDIVPVTVTAETAGRISGITTDIFLGRRDKIMLLSDTGSITPLCEEYLTNLIIL